MTVTYCYLGGENYKVEVYNKRHTSRLQNQISVGLTYQRKYGILLYQVVISPLFVVISIFFLLKK